MRDTLSLPVLPLIESDVVISTYLDHRVQKFILLMLSSLLLFHYDSTFDIEIIEFIFKDFIEGRVLSTVNAYFLEFVSEVLLDRKLLEG